MKNPALLLRWLPLVAAIVVFAATAGYLFTATPEFRSQAVVSVAPRDLATIGADNLGLAASRYRALLAAPTARREAAIAAGVAPALVAKAAAVEVLPNTVTITITATSPQRAVSATVANALANVAVRAGISDDVVSVDMVAPAVRPTRAHGPSRVLLGIAGFAIGITVAVAVFAMQRYVRHYGFPWVASSQQSAAPVSTRVG